MISYELVEMSKSSIPSSVVQRLPPKYVLLVPRHAPLTAGAAVHWVESNFFVNSRVRLKPCL